MKVEGRVKAAIAVAATTKGSKADKSWDESPSVASASALEFNPKDKSEKFPCRIREPILPTNDDVEQANVDTAPLRTVLQFFDVEQWEDHSLVKLHENERQRQSDEYNFGFLRGLIGNWEGKGTGEEQSAMADMEKEKGV